MPRPWRIKIRRPDGTSCNHLSDQPCVRCAEDKFDMQLRPICAPLVVSFGEHIFEHIYDPWEKMEPISSPAKLREECIKRDVRSEYLENSLIHRSGRDKWV